MGSRNSMRAAFIVCALSLALFSAPAFPRVPAQEGWLEPHDFRGHGLNCKSCHHSVTVRTGAALRKSVSEICAGCHRLPPQSHPVDISPTVQVPSDLPLDGQGRLTCVTCHDPHRPYLNPLTGKRTLYLRREGSKKGLCLSCHQR